MFLSRSCSSPDIYQYLIVCANVSMQCMTDARLHMGYVNASNTVLVFLYAHKIKKNNLLANMFVTETRNSLLGNKYARMRTQRT
jgi:hypothetical protein